jgi:segregation and condensation protein A
VSSSPPVLGSPFTEKQAFWQVDIDRFQGPLDLLLHLIRSQDIDVFDIPIARITDQFLQAVKSIDAGQLDSAGEFLEMAATLVRIKAQMLLPRHGEDEELDPRAELVRRLLEYEQIREIVSRLQVAETERSRRFTKGFVESRPRPSLQTTPLETVWEEVMAAAMAVEIPEPRNHEHQVRVRPVAMSEKVALILETLTAEARVEFSRLLRGVDALEARMHGVMTLLASLELTRRRTVFLRQVNPFSELWIYRREEEDAGDDGPGQGGGDVDVEILPETVSEILPEGVVAP